MRDRSWPARGAALALIGLLVVACQATPRDPAPARATAEAWLHSVSTGNAAAAWAALSPDTQERVYGGDERRFAAKVAGADWTALRWRIADPPAWIETEWVVEVKVEGGVLDSVPGFMLTDGLVAPVRGDRGPIVEMALYVVPTDGHRMVIRAGRPWEG